MKRKPYKVFVDNVFRNTVWAFTEKEAYDKVKTKYPIGNLKVEENNI